MDKVSCNKQVIDYARYVESWVQETLFSDFKLATIKTDWNKKRKSHRGGYYASGPGINIAMHFLYSYKHPPVSRFYEYPSFDNDTVIGGFYYYYADFHMKVVVLHEIAHAVQFYYFKTHSYRGKPHGEEFKKYYALLREQFLNKLLPCQITAKNDYKDFISSIQNHEYNKLQDLLDNGSIRST